MPSPNPLTRIARRRQRKAATKAQPTVDMPAVTLPSPSEHSQELESTKKAGRKLSKLLKRRPRRQASPPADLVATVSPLPDITPDDPVAEPLEDPSHSRSSVCHKDMASMFIGAGDVMSSVVPAGSPVSPSFAEPQVVPPPTPANPTALQQTPPPRASAPDGDFPLARHLAAATEDDDSGFREAVEPHTPEHASKTSAEQVNLLTACTSVALRHECADEGSKNGSAIASELRYCIEGLLCTPPAAPCTHDPATGLNTLPSQAAAEKPVSPSSGGGVSSELAEDNGAPGTVQPSSACAVDPPRSDSAPDCAVQSSPILSRGPSLLRQDQSAPNVGCRPNPDETTTPGSWTLASGDQLKHGEKVFTIEGRLDPSTAFARDEANREVVIKLINSLALETPQASAIVTEHRILKEAAERDEPFIDKLLASWKDHRCIYLVMPYYHASIGQVPYGVPISKVLKSPVWDYYTATAEMILGLARLHQMGYAHLEIAPANIVIGPTGHIAFTNFRAAQQVDAQGRVLFVPPFTAVGFGAPECQLLGLLGEITQKADIWSLGLVIAWMYACLADTPYGARAAAKIDAWQVRPGAEPAVDNMRTLDMMRLAAMEMDPLKCNPLPLLKSQNPDLFDMLSKMLVRDPRHRWSAEELMKHRFFHYIDWDDLVKCEPLYKVTRPRPLPTISKTSSPAKNPDYDFSYSCSKDLMAKGLERHYGRKPADARS